MAGKRPASRTKAIGESNGEGVWKTDKRWHRELDHGPGTGFVKEDIAKGPNPDSKSGRKKAKDQGTKPISVSDEYYESYRKAVAGRRTGKY